MITPFITCQAMLPEFGYGIGASISKHRSCKLTRVQTFDQSEKIVYELVCIQHVDFFSHVLPDRDLPLPLHPRSHGVEAPALRPPPSSWSYLPELFTSHSADPQKQTVCTGEDKSLTSGLVIVLGRFVGCILGWQNVIFQPDDLKGHFDMVHLQLDVVKIFQPSVKVSFFFGAT